MLGRSFQIRALDTEMKATSWVLAVVCIATLLVFRTYGGYVLSNPFLTAVLLVPFLLFGIVQMLLLRQRFNIGRNDHPVTYVASRIFYWALTSSLVVVTIAFAYLYMR